MQALNQRVKLAGLDFDALTERQAVQHIIDASLAGEGGWVVTPNVDICRNTGRDPELRSLIQTATLTVADGMPLVWAARLGGHPLPERVAGGSLIFSLSEAAAQHGRSIYLLGGDYEVPYRAAARLRRRYPDLTVVGADAPPFGFDNDTAVLDTIRTRLTAAAPHIVFVGLGFPKQEKLINLFALALPGTWFIGCGAAIPYAAGTLRRAPQWMRRSGLSWLFRLMNEPQRLFRRYLIRDLPYTVRLLLGAALRRRGARPDEGTVSPAPAGSARAGRGA
jgi:N-acetylglucosaminyldiphosphoundecaprenol N-acetyl-beta-D-mannosaminyltransferase